jgi:hypothetical protein
MNLPSCLESIHARHCQIQNDEVRIKFFRFYYCFYAVRRFATDSPIRIRFERSTNCSQDGFIVVGYQDTIRHNFPKLGLKSSEGPWPGQSCQYGSVRRNYIRAD